MPPAEAASAALDTDTNNGSAPASKWALLRWLREGSALDRQRVCMLDCRPDGVVVGRVDGAASFSGATVCGSRSCPVCGPRIASAHRSDIASVVGGARAAGWDVRFLTLTLRHSHRDALADVLDALLACWRGLTKGRWWQDVKDRFGIVGMVRVIECKHGDRFGWHPHVHVLLFLRPVARTATGERSERANVAGGPARSSLRASVPQTSPPASQAPPVIRTSEGAHVARLASELFSRWGLLASAAGYGASVRAQRLLAVTDEHLDRMSGYFTKENSDIAAEMTGGEYKNGAFHRTPLGILRAAAAGDEHSAILYREYEVATRGRRLYASAGAQLRSVLAVAPAPIEAQAAEQPEPVKRDALVRLSRGTYRLAASQGLLADLAVVAASEQSTGWDLAWWLVDRGLSSSPLDPEAVSRAADAWSADLADVEPVF